MEQRDGRHRDRVSSQANATKNVRLVSNLVRDFGLDSESVADGVWVVRAEERNMKSGLKENGFQDDDGGGLSFEQRKN